jgi:hypothetical protein
MQEFTNRFQTEYLSALKISSILYLHVRNLLLKSIPHLLTTATTPNQTPSGRADTERTGRRVCRERNTAVSRQFVEPCGKSVVESVNMSEPVLFIAIMPPTVPSPPKSRCQPEWHANLKKELKILSIEEANAYFVKVDTEGPMTIGMLLGILMPYSLIPAPSTSFEYLLLRNKLSILYEDVLHPVNFPILVELNSGFDIGVLLFRLIVRIIRI